MQSNDRKLRLMTHLIAGYPSIEENIELLHVMAEKKVDFLEIQLPFSEPIADGPLFVKANQKAISSGMTTEKYFKLFSQAAQILNKPILMMGYYNSIYAMGAEKFFNCLLDAGGTGMIIPDLPLGYSEKFDAHAQKHGLYHVHLIAPNTSRDRIIQIARSARGMVYIVARKGVTGKPTKTDQRLKDYIERCRQNIRVPLAVGFGISSPADLEYLKDKADIAVVGSALLQMYLDHGLKAVANALDHFNRVLDG